MKTTNLEVILQDVPAVGNMAYVTVLVNVSGCAAFRKAPDRAHRLFSQLCLVPVPPAGAQLLHGAAVSLRIREDMSYSMGSVTWMMKKTE